MDLEDLIAPSKVSKNGGQSTSSTPISTTAPSNTSAAPETEASAAEKEEKDSESKSSSDGKTASEQQEESGERRGRRTRSKRPRSGDHDFPEALPERKRELRSSASRLAAAAAARYEREAALKLANESQN